jgi:hypothetical protein
MTAGAAFILGNAGTATGGGQATLTKATLKSARKSAKFGKKGQKHQPRRIAIMARNGNDGEKTDNSCEGFVVATERNFKWETQLPTDHFKKLLEAICPHHPYPVKHKLQDCTMVKIFMMLGATSRGGK